MTLRILARPLAWLVSVAGMAACFYASEAHACAPLLCEAANVAPRPEATIPANAVLATFPGYPPSGAAPASQAITLTDATGASVPLSTRVLSNAVGWQFWEPASPL